MTNKEVLSKEQKVTTPQHNEESNRLHKEVIVSPSLSSLVTPATLAVFQGDNSAWDTIIISDGKKLAESSPPVNWTTLKKLNTEDRSVDEPSENISNHPSPIISRLDYKDMKTFGGMPSEEEPELVECKNCSKAIIVSHFSKHMESCSKSRDRESSVSLSNLKIEDTESIVVVSKASHSTKKEKANSKKRKSSVVSVGSDVSDAVPSKRPPSHSTDKPPQEKKQKVKKEKPKPTPKVKAPLDLDKQCGVIGPNGLPCTRSLTCKSHSMGAKRAVVGRSQKYDVLLAAYQKKSIGRPNNHSQVNADQKTPGSSALSGTVSQVDDNNMDSDEEVNAVLDAIKTSNPRPLATRQILFVRRRNHCLKIRDMLLDAIVPKERPIVDGLQSLIHMKTEDWTAERRPNGVV